MVPLPGSAEAGLVGVFVFYGSSFGVAAAAVIVYRTFQAGLPLFLGLLGFADLRRL
jgi:uncharacterized membrane protein YbhN (UPF0104 family)